MTIRMLLPIVEIGSITEGRARDSFAVFFSAPPRTLLEFAEFVRDEYLEFSRLKLNISEERFEEVTNERDTPDMYHRLEHSGEPYLFVIKPCVNPIRRLEDYGDSLLLEIARGKLKRPEFNRFINYLNRQA